jgi:glycosyltransferase involved in cell wall biosynthesis
MSPLRVVALLDAAAMTGPAKNLIQFCRRANASGDETFATRVSIATISRGPKAAGNSFVEAARAAGIAVDVMHERYRYDLRVIDQLKEVIRERNADIIETHGVRMHFNARFSGLAAKLPWVAFHHGYTAEDFKMLAYNQLDRWSLRQAARIFTDCGPFADQLAGFGIPRERIRVLGSSIEIREPANSREVHDLRVQLGIENGETAILSVGRLSSEKAQADLVAAAAHLVRDCPQQKFRIVLVGDGPERDRLKAATAAAGLSKVIVFAGQQKDVSPFYGLAQMFVLPSLSEGSPNVLLEAMAAGVPIVSTAVGGVPEIVEHERSAILVPAGKPENLADAIGRLIANPALAARLAENAAVIVRAKFSPDVYCRTVLQAYSDVSAK